MIFELTRDYNIIVPLMISNLVAYAVARSFSHTPIYEALAIQDGVYLPHAKGQRQEPDLLVGDAMRSPAVLLRRSTSIAVARQLVPEGDCLVGENGTLLGIVLGSDLDDALHKGTGGAAVATIVNHDVLKKLVPLHPDEPADIVLHRLGQFNLSVLPVVDRRDITRVLGEVTLEDLLEAYRNASA
jgi:CIC family chloride channel protein